MAAVLGLVTHLFGPSLNVLILLILGKVLRWLSRNVDYVQAFHQEEFDEDEHIYTHLPRKFHVDDA